MTSPPTPKPDPLRTAGGGGMTVLPPPSRRFQPLAGPLRARVTEPPPACGERDGEDGAAARCRAPQPELAPELPRRTGRKENGGPRGGGEERGGGERLAGSLPPSRPRPAGGDTKPSRPPTGARGARPACSAGPRQRKETGTKRDEEAGGSPGSLPPSLPPRASAAAASSFARSEPTPGSGRSKPRRGWGGHRARPVCDRGARSGGGRKRGERKREERGRGLTRIRLKRLLSLGGSGTDGMVRAAPGQARLEGGRGRPERGGCRYEGGQGEEEGRKKKPRTPRGGGGGATPARAAAAATL